MFTFLERYLSRMSGKSMPVDLDAVKPFMGFCTAIIYTYSLDVLQMPAGASTSAADPKLPPGPPGSRKLAGFLPVPPVTKEPHFRPFSEKHRIPTPRIRGGTEGNTFHCRKHLNLSESITLFFISSVFEET